MQIKVQTTLEVTEQYLTDVLVTAVEGGITYWCFVERYKPDLGTAVIREEVPNDEGSGRHILDAQTIARGIERILTEQCEVRADIRRGLLIELLNPDEAGIYIDSDGADAILQAALFNEIVYG